MILMKYFVVLCLLYTSVDSLPVNKSSPLIEWDTNHRFCNDELNELLQKACRNLTPIYSPEVAVSLLHDLCCGRKCTPRDVQLNMCFDDPTIVFRKHGYAEPWEGEKQFCDHDLKILVFQVCERKLFDSNYSDNAFTFLIAHMNLVESCCASKCTHTYIQQKMCPHNLIESSVNSTNVLKDQLHNASNISSVTATLDSFRKKFNRQKYYLKSCQCTTNCDCTILK